MTVEPVCHAHELRSTISAGTERRTGRGGKRVKKRNKLCYIPVPDLQDDYTVYADVYS